MCFNFEIYCTILLQVLLHQRAHYRQGNFRHFKVFYMCRPGDERYISKDMILPTPLLRKLTYFCFKIHGIQRLRDDASPYVPSKHVFSGIICPLYATSHEDPDPDGYNHGRKNYKDIEPYMFL